ncbi:MAG: metal ABC transporter permease [Magnetococcales bacterium]|nr:metal ABC transporter permease [Magnetococcales bacterium]MBF0116417.1 metal ABC transporter permease [Magnetococcales bacterium]
MDAYFVAAACLGLLLLAGNPHGGEHLQDLLSGQILWTTVDDLVPVAGLYAVLLILWFAGQSLLGDLGFYLLFALMVTASVQLVGIYLVFASLIVPALAVHDLQGYQQLLAGYAVGILAYLLGLFLSALWDLPTGPVIVCAMVVLMVLVRIRNWRSPTGFFVKVMLGVLTGLFLVPNWLGLR